MHIFALYISTLFLLWQTETIAQSLSINCEQGLSPTQEITLDAEQLACVATKDKYQCQKLENSENKNKIIQCDKNSLSSNKISDASLSCVLDGVQLSIDQLTDLINQSGNLVKLIVGILRAPPNAPPSTVGKWLEANALLDQDCDKSIEKKRLLLKSYNTMLPDPQFRLEESLIDNFKGISCFKLGNLIEASYHSYEEKLLRSKVKSNRQSTAPRDLRLDLINSIKEILNDANISYECYSRKAKAELLCLGLTSLAVDALSGVALLKGPQLAKRLYNYNRLNSIGKKVESIKLMDKVMAVEGLDKLYHKGLCSDNIYYLLQKLRAQNPDVDLSNAKVMYLFSRWSGDYPHVPNYNLFSAQKTRNGPIGRWGYHVVLKVKDEIFDFDYDSHLKPVHAKEFFKEMFGAEWKAGETEKKVYAEKSRHVFLDDDHDFSPDKSKSELMLHVRSIPADDYLTNHKPASGPNGSIQNRNEYKAWITTPDKYEDQSVKDFLKKLENEP